MHFYLSKICFKSSTDIFTGISLAGLLKGKKDSDFETTSQQHQKFSNVAFISDGTHNSGGHEHSYSELGTKFNHVRHRTYDDGKFVSKNEDSASSFIERIIHKQNKMPALQLKKKRSMWDKLSRFVLLRHWRTSNLDLVPEPSEPIIVHRNLLQKSETQSYQSSKRLSVSPVENRRTSWQPSKASVSNWNRSELFSNSVDKSIVKKRRKTIADAGMLLKTNFCQEKPQKKLPGILMTGSGLNVRNDSPDISPMSSNYSLTPSTTDEEEDNEDKEEPRTETALQKETGERVSLDKVPVFPSISDTVDHLLMKIASDFKANMEIFMVSVLAFFY